MAVPYIFSTTPGGSSIPLAELDANFAYLTSGTPSFLNANITGALTVGGVSTFSGPATFNNTLTVTGNSQFSGPAVFNDLTVDGVLTVDGQTINPTGITGTGLWVFNNNPTLISPILGTPASGDLQNCTNFPVAQISGLGAGVETALTYPADAPGGFITHAANNPVPPGAVFYFAATVPPIGYLVCDGSSVSTTTYADLFAVVGYNFGGGGATFNLPNLTGAFIRGFGGNSAAFGTLQTDGFATHTHGITDPGHNHTLTDPGHNHTVTDPGHNHTVTDPGHNHTINDPGHAHGVTDPGHGHTTQYPYGSASGPLPFDCNLSGPLNNRLWTIVNNNTTGVSVNSGFTGITNSASATGVTNNSSATGVSNQSNTTGITVAGNTTGITAGNTGVNETRPLNMALLPCIKY